MTDESTKAQPTYPSVLFAITLSPLLRFMASDYAFGIFKYFLSFVAGYSERGFYWLREIFNIFM